MLVPRIISYDNWEIFNIVRFVDGQRDNSNNRDREVVNNLISSLGIIDVPLMSRRFTWSSIREDPSLAKFDRVFMSKNWEAIFNLALAMSVGCCI